MHPGWSDEEAERMTAASLTLVGDAVINPAIGGTDNGEDAGADLRPLAPLGLVGDRDE
jgi:hypothetical protein